MRYTQGVLAVGEVYTLVYIPYYVLPVYTLVYIPYYVLPGTPRWYTVWHGQRTGRRALSGDKPLGSREEVYPG